MSVDLENDELLAPLRKRSNDALVLGGILLKSKLGEGAAGCVYSGIHTRLNIPVAVKVLKNASPESLSGFIREARLTVSIDHPNLVRMFDVNCDEAAGLHYIVMEFAEGSSAYQLLESSLLQRRRGLSLGAALEIILGATRGMAEVHARGIIHRDLKPDNLLIRTRDHAVKVSDLGLATLSSGEHSNEMVGTTGFLSPEVLLGEKVTAAADVYALGASFYELLTGVLPHGNDAEQLYYTKQLTSDPIDPRQYVPNLDAAVVEVIMKCLRYKPEERYADAGELLPALESLCTRVSNGPSRGTALLSSPTVMVVDDDEAVIELMRDALEASGFRPVCFSDPVEALRQVAQVQPDVAVIDRNMPRLDGVSLCRMLRQHVSDLPVLMLSGDTSEVAEAMRGGIDDYLLKPANIRDIVVRVRLLSKLRSTNRERQELELQWRRIRVQSSMALAAAVSA